MIFFFNAIILLSIMILTHGIPVTIPELKKPIQYNNEAELDRLHELLEEEKALVENLQGSTDGMTWSIYGDVEVPQGNFIHYTVVLDGLLGGGHTATIDVDYHKLENHNARISSFTDAVDLAVATYAGPGRISYNGSRLTFLALKNGDTCTGIKISVHAHYTDMTAPSEDIRVQLHNPGSTTGARVSLGRNQITTTILQANQRSCVDDPEGLVRKAGFKCEEVIDLGCDKDLSLFDSEGIIPSGTKIRDAILCPASCYTCEEWMTQEKGHHEPARKYCNLKMQKRSTQCLPGLTFLGVGFDAQKASNDDEAFRSTEPVMSFQTSKWKQNDNIFPDAKNYIVPSPDEGTWDPRIKDKEQKVVEKWNNAKQVSANLAAKFGIKSSGMVGKSGSMSYSHGSTQQQMKATGTHTFILGTFRLNPAHCNLSTPFIESVKHLPNEFTRNDLRPWYEFFGLYGTHYVHSFSVGGRILITKKIDSCSDMSSIGAEISAELSKGGKKDEKPNEGGGSKSSSKGGNAQTSRIDYFGGGVDASKVFRRDGWQAFKQLVVLNPDLVDIKVHSLVSLFARINQERKIPQFKLAMEHYLKAPHPKKKGSALATPDCKEKPKHTHMWIAGGILSLVLMYMVYKCYTDYQEDPQLLACLFNKKKVYHHDITAENTTTADTPTTEQEKGQV